MKRRKQTSYEHPTTYEGFIAYEQDCHARRLAQLKRAEKAIRAVTPDLTLLAQRRLSVGVGRHSMYLVDCSYLFQTEGKPKSALFMDSGLFRANGDRLVDGFISLGWVVEAVGVNRYQVLLRRPKSQTRIVFDVTDECAKSLRPREVQQ
jgi:hypothetical protein